MVQPALDQPVQRGTEALARFAMRATGAEGYELIELDPLGAVSRRSAHGVVLEIPSWIRDARALFKHNDAAVVCYPLRHDVALVGLVAFAFDEHHIDDEKLLILDRLALWLSHLCAIPYATVQLATRIGMLDAELAGLKVAEKTRDLTARSTPARVLALLDKHVERVIQGRRAPIALDQLLKVLEDRLEERKLLALAKVHLERFGMTEEQAYLHLRRRSRSTRRRLRLVAQELIRTQDDTV